MSQAQTIVPVTISTFDKQYLESLKADFANYDADSSGCLDKKEFTNWLTNNGTPEKKAKHIFDIADADRNGRISFEEFRNFATTSDNIVIHGNLDAYIQMVFNAVDRKNTGHLNFAQFKQFMKYMDTPLGFFNARKMFRQYDEDGNGTVEFEELSKILNFQMNKSLT
ncbi:EF hand family protein [Tritrichomonas foetus]|uniref:EF hand family protein n=1 Tax=Tritrichomonas foetus TaxID=1144522 RepID=A0A1J4J4S5_9EUKA|nr:EF hand family protein [Tritrichomonas foetus]|eukprot:OHS93143.1 EF hand family protein [Tritrichomonas foetus]